MKKFMIVIQFMLLIAFSSSSYALEGQGKIVQIKSCGTGVGYGGLSYIFFKLSDGNWFGIFGNNNKNAAIEDNFNHSMLLTAFSMDLDVEATATYLAPINLCGVSAQLMLNKTTDSLSIAKD